MFANAHDAHRARATCMLTPGDRYGEFRPRSAGIAELDVVGDRRAVLAYTALCFMGSEDR